MSEKIKIRLGKDKLKRVDSQHYGFWLAYIKNKFSQNKQINLAIEVKYNQLKSRMERSLQVDIDKASDSITTDLIDYIRAYVERNMSMEEIINTVIDGQIEGYLELEEINDE